MIYEAPDKLPKKLGPSVFLGGSIDNGTVVDWQDKLANQLNEENFSILNPRRKDWDPDAGAKELSDQIMWEMDAQNKADIILYNFLKDSKSPITLLELGLFAKSGKVIVVCPKKFYRYDNVKFICDMFKIPLKYTMDAAKFFIKSKLSSLL
ncbi:MAG: hypothetical protein COA52_01190 [Hyphomicrobiales bacterium]|nr:MAG: hypothetical protein COA52_00100 [Hyphomicrobiales bacterium]PCJ96852.1 MAG: hypothetical protein COA52_01190 [Hyphomicrobiales bacterium]